MRRVVLTMTVSLDGFATDPDGGLDWAATDLGLFRFVTDQTRALVWSRYRVAR